MAKTQNSKSLIYWSRVVNKPVSSSIPEPAKVHEHSAIQFHGRSTFQSSTAQDTSSDRTASSIPSECTAHSLQERNDLANVGPFAAHETSTSLNDSSTSQTDGSEPCHEECGADSCSQNPATLDGFRPQSSSLPEAVIEFRQRQFNQHSVATLDSISTSTRPIVVVMGWMQSTQRQLAAYLRVLNECGWDALACHPPLLHLWMPWRAEALARAVLAELEKELAGRPRPVVFMSFSGGYKACQWKIMEALLSPSAQESMHRHDASAAGAAAASAPVSSAAFPSSALASEGEGTVSSSHRHFLSLLRECYAGQVFDSSPVDFTSDLGVRFLSQPPPTQPRTILQTTGSAPAPAATPATPASTPAGQVFDSSPVDFTSDLGVRFLSRPPPVTAQPPPTPQPSATSQPPLTPQSVGSAPASAASPATTPAPTAAPKQPGSVRHTLVRSAAVVLDWLLLPEFERQRAAQWTALLHCSPLAPVLLLCSTDDQLAPIEFIWKYEREAVGRGAVLTKVEWSTSEHVGHMRHHRHEYITALRSFLGNALSLWEQQRDQQQRGSMGGCRAELAREITSRL